MAPGWSALAVLLSTTAWPCSCGTGGTAETFAASEVAFEGELLWGPTWQLPDRVLYLVEVRRVFKGSVASPAVVTTSMACGSVPLPGEPWIFLSRAEDTGLLSLQTDVCSGSAPVSHRVGEMAIFGHGRPPRSRIPEAATALVFGATALALAWRRLKVRE